MAKPPRRPILRIPTLANPRTASQPVVGREADPRQSGLFDQPLPAWIEPCLPTLVAKAPTGPKWVHEITWDGYRVSAYLDNGKVTIRTRRGHDWTTRFPAIASAINHQRWMNDILRKTVPICGCGAWLK